MGDDGLVAGPIFFSQMSELCGNSDTDFIRKYVLSYFIAQLSETIFWSSIICEKY